MVFQNFLFKKRIDKTNVTSFSENNYVAFLIDTYVGSKINCKIYKNLSYLAKKTIKFKALVAFFSKFLI